MLYENTYIVDESPINRNNDCYHSPMFSRNEFSEAKGILFSLLEETKNRIIQRNILNREVKRETESMLASYPFIFDTISKRALNITKQTGVFHFEVNFNNNAMS